MLLRIVLALAIAGSGAAEAPSSDAEAFLRGMVVSCPRWGPIWGSRAMAESLEELSALGVNAVAIHPYGWLRNDGRIEFRPAHELDFLHKAVDMTDRAGIELFWKPHLGYWGTRFSHRGAIQFDDSPASAARFLRDYQDFIVDQARFAHHQGVDLLAVGVELEGTTHFESAWRRIIAEVRRVYRGKIVYAANWDALDRVPFWDAVDFIGVHAYFPLSSDTTPSRQTLARGWDRHLAELEALSARTGKPVLVAEIGYNSSARAAREPWAYRNEDTLEARSLRVRLIDVALDRLEHADFITGMFWWKWMPGEGERRDFSMREAEAQEVLRRRWGREPGRTTAR